MTYRILNRINSPGELKQLKIPELERLAAEIRHFLIHTVSDSGGHLASNLGVVELTIALHYCLTTPPDKICWDVGHQSYVHKILTGRKDKLHTIRQFGGLSGYPRPQESEHDAFTAGHSSNSISAALGLALGRDAKSGNHIVAAVIGDGSMTGGMSYEGLNHAGRAKTQLLVVLNDNQMSISKNVGALSKSLNRIRLSNTYIGTKRNVKSFLQKVPVVGEPIGGVLEKMRDGLKYLLVPGTFFEELGFDYVGPVDGHDTQALINIIGSLKHHDSPVLLHIITEKGKGYKHAESNPEKFHGIEPFDIETGDVKKKKTAEIYTDIFGDEILKLAREHDNLVAVTAAMPSGCGLTAFGKEFPDRLYDVGIAEGHAVAFAAGLASAGLMPVFAVYSSFLQRGFDQIIHDVCVANLPVVFAIDRAGIVGADGETHQGAFDLSYLSQIPNMTVMSPRSGSELRKMLRLAVNLRKPVAIRYPKSAVSGDYPDMDTEIKYGRCEPLEQGERIGIVSVGSMISQAAEVVRLLKEKGFSPALINARFVKPVDERIFKELGSCDYIFTLEDNALNGGFGANLCRMAEHSCLAGRVHSFGLPDEFIPHGTRDELFAKYELDAASIFKKILEVIEHED